MEENEINPKAITCDLPTKFIGQRVIYYPKTVSTMEEARKEALWGCSAGTVVIASEQTAGKGRLQRSWFSPIGGLALSVVLRPNIAYLPYMIMLASLAVVYCIEKVTDIKPMIKWPNDVMINKKKVSGILIQNDIHKSSLKHTIIGIGINVNMQMKGLKEIVSTATSVSDEFGKAVSIQEIIRHLLIEMEKLYVLLPQNQLIYDSWKSRLATVGQDIRITQGKTLYYGYAESVARDGSLILRQTDGQLMKIVAGEVTLR